MSNSAVGRDTLRCAIFRPQGAVPEKNSLLETPQTAGCYAASAPTNPQKNRHPKDVYSGGEKGIRTLDGVLAHTRFPVVRLRPAQPSLHAT